MNNPTLFYLLTYVGWALLLLLTLLSARSLRVLAGKAKADDFPPYHYNPACPINRLSRAHLNTLEFLAILTPIVVVALWREHTALAAQLLPWMMAARIAQSLTHLVGVSHWLVMTRFTFFLVQVGLAAWIAIDLFVAGI